MRIDLKLGWLKRYMPRGLYGRAALILLVPIITLQVVVSVVFIQRHYEDVARQMTRALALDTSLIAAQIDAAPDIARARAAALRLGRPLEIAVAFSRPVPDPAFSHPFTDLSGREVIRTLRERVPGLLAVDLATDFRTLFYWIDSRFGPVEMTVSRARVSASNPHQFLVLMVFVGALMTMVAMVFLRNQLRPIRRLARAAEAFGRGEVVAYTPGGAIEVRAAGKAFLAMRARIERQIEQRTMMLSGVSHDLRTPLTRLKLALSMVEDTEAAADMLRDLGDMERLLDEFLAFSRTDALEEMEERDLCALVRAVADKVTRRGGRVSLGEMACPLRLRLRPMAIERALENLIGNALRHAGQVRVSVMRTARAARVEIEDDGPGIPVEQRARALEPFVRLDASRNQNHGSGVGLGLSIADDIARRHGGALELLRSEDLGGLKVVLTLALS